MANRGNSPFLREIELGKVRPAEYNVLSNGQPFFLPVNITVVNAKHKLIALNLYSLWGLVYRVFNGGGSQLLLPLWSREMGTGYSSELYESTKWR